VDYQARLRFYEGATAGVLKCTSRFNHHLDRHQKINKESMANKCSRCLEAKDWEHVLLWIANEEVYDKFLFWLKARLIESENADQVAHKILQFVNNISQYLKGGNDYRTLQPILGFKMLFCGFVIRD